MSSEDVAEFYKDLLETDALLRDLKRGTKAFINESDSIPAENNSRHRGDSTSEQRRLASSSAWARSTTKKEYTPVVKRGGATTAPQSDIDPTRSDRYVRTKTPEYTFGTRPSSAARERRHDDHFTGDYDIKVDSLSTKKRVRAPTISTTARLDPMGFEHGRVVPHVPVDVGTQQPQGETTANNADGDLLDGMSSVGDGLESAGKKDGDNHQPAGKAFSFGKGKRFAEQSKTAAQSRGTGEVGTKDGILDVEAAARALEPRTATAVMGPRPSISGGRLGSATSTSAPGGSAPSPSKMNLDTLAYRPRTPNVTIMRPEHNFDKTKVTGDVDLGAPGPGYYQINDAALAKPLKSHSKPVGVVYHPESQPKKPLAYNAKVQVEQESKAAIGPGTYAPEKSFSYVSHRQPVLAIMREADSKPTAHMRRKRYFEQKARDMREAHDFLKEANLSQVLTRAPNVTLAPPKWSQQDPRREKILQEHRLSKMRPSSAGDRTRGRVKIGDLELGRSFDDLDAPPRRSSDSPRSSGGALYNSQDRLFRGVERRVPTGAFMRAEVAARRSTSAMRQAKPGVVQRLVEERVGPAATRRYYGPQLPVQWAEDRAAMSTRGGRKKRRTAGAGASSGDSGSDSGSEGGGERSKSPTAELRRLLADRGNEDYLDADAEETDYTRAYLKSRYSGSLLPKKPAVVMTQPKPRDARNAIPHKSTIEVANFDYLGPQLQPDWLVEAEKRSASHKNQSLRMDRVPGRERVKVHQKGLTEVIEFTDRPTRSDPMGPGYYDVKSELEMAKAAERAMGLPFAKAIARKDQVGAFGERPEAAVEALQDEELGDLYFRDGEGLDLDSGAAKDKHIEHRKPKAPLLYAKDRHPAEKPKVDDHLGGTWFEGMAEEALKRPAAVDFARMTGRPAPTEGRLEAEALHEMVGPMEGQIDLEVQDWHPNKPKSATGYVMPDPKKQPRFPKDKAPEPIDPDALLQPLPNYDYLKGKEPMLVRMDKMRGRADDGSDMEEAVLRQFEGERVDVEGARQLAAERDQGIRQGGEALSGYKRTPKAVDMSKQIGRHDGEAGKDSEQLLADLNDEREARFVENPELTAPILRNPKDIRRGDGGGARDWSKIPGRNTAADAEAEAQVLGSDVFPREELILEPTPEGTSKHKALQGGVAWDKGSAVSRFPEMAGRRVDADGEVMNEEGQLDLEDVDPGKFKKGMQGLGGAGAGGGVNMAQQLGRPGGLREDAAIKAVGLEQEELILDSGENPMNKRVGAATFGDKGKVAGIEGTNAGQHALRELREETGGLDREGQGLDLRPTDQYLQKNVRGGVSMRNMAAQSTRKEQAVEAEIRNSREVLKLEPTTADRLTRPNPILATSMSGKQALRESRHEAQLEAENRKSATSLNLEPTDVASRRRVTGGSSMGNKTTRIASSTDALAIKDFYLTTTEELKIDPSIHATRVSMPNASTVASKTERIRSSKHDLIEAELRLDDEELLLEPKQGRLVKNTSASALGSSTVRFATPKEAAIEEVARQQAEPEELILEPSDKATRKTATATGFSKGTSGRGGATKKETAPAVRTAKAATVTSNKAGKTATGGASTSGGRSAKDTKAAPSASAKGSASHKERGTGTAVASRDTKAGRAGGDAPSDDAPPATPVITVPEPSGVAPRPSKRGNAVYDNLSPSEVIDMIDMQAKMKDLKV